jgi:hypothetical protein
VHSRPHSNRRGASRDPGLALAACAERDQVAEFKKGKYQGKPDTPPWDNAPLAYGGKWTKGDRASWENQIKTRQLGQNEDVRINQ